MTPIRGFDSLTSPIVSYKEIFPSEEIPELLEIQVAQVDKIVGVDPQTKKFIYNFIKKEDNKPFLKIEIKETTNEGFNLSVLKDGSNESKKFFIKDSEMAQFQENCRELRCYKDSFLTRGYIGVAFALIEINVIVCAVGAGANCLQAKNMTELSKNFFATAVATAVFVGGLLLAYNSVTAANKTNCEDLRKLHETLLNKHLTVIRACNQNATEVNPAQLLTFENIV